MLFITVPVIDPVIFHIYGPIALRWYGLAYIAGIFGAALYGRYLNSLQPFMNKKPFPFDDLIFYGAIGILLGGRFGYILFYNLDNYIKNPLEILMLWEGGMSFHGGLIGSIISLYFISRKNNLEFLVTADLLSCIAPIGLFFGRIANFINRELIGKPTSMNWGVVYLDGDDNIPRHPSQLYEALLEGVLIFLIMLLARRYIRTKGILASMFLILYGITRIIAEVFRQPDSHIGTIANHFSAGQLLSIPLVVIGLSLFLYCKKYNTTYQQY
jgi:phosphatidylglycerol:prolipoprotein diacylglycerol transferase